MNFIHTGQSRGFAFAEFNSVEEAKAWYQMKQVAQDTRFYIQTCIQPSPIQKKTFLFENETKLFSNKKNEIENKFVVPYFNYAKSIQIFNYFFTFNYYSVLF